jgi:hypothetical protein
MWNVPKADGKISSAKSERASPPSIIRMIKSRRMRWTRHEVRMEEKNAYKYWRESQRKKDH